MAIPVCAYPLEPIADDRISGPVESKFMNQAPSPISLLPHPGWRVAFPAVLLTLAAILAIFRETALSMVDIWVRSGTYAHGFIVPPMTLWLIWRMREKVAVLAPRHSYPAVLLLATAGFAWLLGEVATVNVVPQFALIFMLVFAVLAVLGPVVARSIAFPLLFLFFAVPFGDFTQPKLMEWTAKFTVLGLRLTGVPVYSEGQNLVIPSGSWSVVEACSGVRYLIASVTVGTLFAYLTYHSLKRRLLFVGVSIIVPIIANWLRAYMIVMLGHLSGNKLAAGVDHLIYGWAFFGVVILTMFWIGARWREDGLPVVPALVPTSGETVGGVPTVSSVLAAAVVTVLVAALWPLAQRQIDQHMAQPVRQISPLGPIAGWHETREGLYDWSPRFENYAARTQVVLEKGGRLAGLFVAYYRNQDQQHKLISSTNVLVTSNDPVWSRIGGGTREISFNQQPLKIRTTRLRGPGSTQMIVWQWYWVNGRWTSSDVLAKAYTAFSRLTGQGDDSAVVILYAQQAPPAEAEATLAAFADAAGEVIETALRQTTDSR